MPDLIARYRDEIGWISFNRPSVRNALSKQMWDELPLTIASLQRQGARVIIFRGEGENFCAGADLAELAEITTPEAARAQWLSIRNALNAIAACEIPTIALIVGACMGGGCLLACACDLRFGESSAKFSIPIAQLGIHLDQDNIARLISIVGRAAATELLFTAKVIDVTKAYELGLVNDVGALPAIDRLTVEAANAIKANSPASIAQTKRAIAQICQRGRVEEDQESVIDSYLSDEFRSRISKLLKR